jgi:hypothetical protein
MRARKCSRLNGLLVLVIACSGATAQPIAVPADPQWSDEQIDQMIFQQDHNAAGARGRLVTQLTLHVEDIDRVCKLTDAQKKKLDLAGRGDIKRFFDRYDIVKQKCQALKGDAEGQQRIWQEINPLQNTLQTGLFHQDSLFYKSLHHTLTPDQSSPYAAAARERRESHHRATVELVVLTLEQCMPLRDAQRQELIRLVVKETKPPRKSSPNDYSVVMYQLSRIPEDKLKPLFEASQWKATSRLLAQYRGMEPWLTQSGLLETESDDANEKAAAPTP